MSLWIKVDADFDNHPKAIRAGYHGKNVFQLLLRLNKTRGFDGLIPASFADPVYLGARLPLDPELTKQAVEDAVVARLLARELDGSIRIIGWDDEWRGPESTASRVRKWREKQASETNGNGAKRDVTIGNDVNGRRSDQ